MNRLQNVPLSNDWMFGEVMSDPDICKAVLEEIIRIPIERLEYVQKQDAIASRYESRGVRLDVYAADSEGTLYNVEMQTVNKRNLERRIRYYQAQIDTRTIEHGVGYEEMPKSYIIFIYQLQNHEDLASGM